MKPLDESVCDECGAPAYTRWVDAGVPKGDPVMAITVCEPCNETFVAECNASIARLRSPHARDTGK